ncbi:MAG TPA: DUF3341 domain-containing protein [Phenylobacterium sp.]|uniref:DUF3341 domain-containing protein n=1 Tax=Phenylobacterium sp. TaxID=1871053 RepID=UPI002CA51FE0|nr:DUF3341 domain-containing protein [Phenylobacterium sp.]HSV03278.1 DUF3341 domain-containing protein [Phenylobacterium sp.]
MAERAAVFGLVAEFDRAEALLEAVRRARTAGFRRMEAYSPFPIDGLAEAIGFKESWVPLATLLGGIAGAVIGYGMQVYTSTDYRIDIMGRPAVAPPAFALITFEVMVLIAVIASVVVMLLLNGLPRLSHPLFDVPSFHLASLNKFFLVIEARDPRFGDHAREFLDGLHPVRVDEAPLAEAAR